MQTRSDTSPVREISVWACLALCLFAPFSGLAQAGLQPILPKITEHFASTPGADTLVRMTVSGLSFAMIVGCLFAGVLGERIGQRRMLLSCMVLYAVFGSMGYFIDNLYALVLSRIVLGAVTSCAGVLAIAILTTELAEKRRNRWLGFNVTVGTFAILPIYATIGPLAERDWRLVFLLYLLIIPLIVLLSFTLARPAAPTSARPADQGPILAKRPWFAIAMGVVCGVVGGTPLIFTPFHMAELKIGSAEQISLVFMLNGLVGGAISFGYGWYRQWLSLPQVFALGFAFQGVGLLIAAFGTTLPMMFLAFTFFGTGLALNGPNMFAAAAAMVSPAERTRSVAFARAGYYGAPMLAQLALEPVAHAYGSGAAIASVSLFSFCAIVLALVFAGRLKAHPEV